MTRLNQWNLIKISLFFLQIQFVSSNSSKSRIVEEKRQPQVDDDEIDYSRSRVWGPGLAPHDIVLPARYFYVQLVRRDGKDIWGDELHELKVRVDCAGDRQVWSQVINRKTGSFIVRYKLLQSCLTGLRIIVTFRERNLGKSPYNYNVNVESDVCNCPKLNSQQWKRRVGCSIFQQIQNDLSSFKNVNFNEVIEEAKGRFSQPRAFSFCHYQIKDNEIYRKCYGEHVGFHIFSDAILLSIARKMHLPDTEFIMNLGDWPLVPLDLPLIPVFSWCKSNTTGDILVPTYELTEASLEAMGRVSLDILTVQGNIENNLLWHEKKEKIFWRGRDSRQERLNLITIAQKYPHLFNVSLTNFFFFRDKMDIYGPPSPHISFFAFFHYKYQLSIDGTVAAYRLPFLLAGDGVVFKVDSPYVEHFYGELRSWTHYIPVAPDLSDIVEKILWAKSHDEEAKAIGARGRKFAQERLMPLDVFCYHVNLLNEWSKRLAEPVNISKDMEKVDQPKPKIKCNCSPSVRPAFDDKEEL